VERSAGGVLLNFGERLFFDEFERSSLDDAGDGTALQALRADAHGLMRAIFRGDTNITKVRFENTARDAGHFRTNTAEILGATASLDNITDLLSLTAKATNCHCTSSLSFYVSFRCFSTTGSSYFNMTHYFTRNRKTFKPPLSFFLH